MTNKNYIKKSKLSEDKVQALLNSFSKHNIKIEDEYIYLFPEEDGEKTIINEFSPDIMKIAKKHNIKCEIIYNKENYSYLSLRDSEILLPIIMDASNGILINFIYDYIKNNFIHKNKSKLKVRIIKKEKDSYSEIDISGEGEYVLEALKLEKKGN